MKIEMGESVMLSWLRHVKNCQTVQMNWKVSTLWDYYNEEKVEKVLQLVNEQIQPNIENLIREELKGHNLDFFKKNRDCFQLLRQAEIDLIGIDTTGDSLSNIYAVDIAFHENGLGYGKNKGENISKVLGKMIRSALAIYGYFNVKKGTIIFASPKIQPGIYQPLKKAVDRLNILFREMASIDSFNFEFKLYANEEFSTDVLDLVHELADEVSDTSELYLRSHQLGNLFTGKRKKNNKNSNADSMQDVVSVSKEISIGKFVRNSLMKLFGTNSIDENMIKMLMNKEESKKILGIDYPLLKVVVEDVSISEQAKVDGRLRYWTSPIKYRSKIEYLICSQWYEDRHRQKFLEWLGTMK